MSNDYMGYPIKVTNGSPGPEAIDHSASNHSIDGGQGYARGLWVSDVSSGGDVKVTFDNGVTGTFEATSVGDFLMGRFVTVIWNVGTTATVSHGWI